MGICARIQDTYDSCWKDQNGNCVFCRPGYFFKSNKCQKCNPTCDICDEKTCLKCKMGFWFDGGIKCNQCKKDEQIFNPATRKCVPRKIMDYSRFDVAKNSEKRYFVLPKWKSYKKPLKVPKFEDIRMLIHYKLVSFKKPTDVILKNYFVKLKKKATEKDKKFQTRIKYIKKAWFIPESHNDIVKYTYTVRFFFKIKPEKHFIFKIFPYTRNP